MRFRRFIAGLQAFFDLSVSSLAGTVRPPFYARDMLEQMDYAGPGSLFIVVTVSLFIGMALSLQVAADLAPMGLSFYTGKITGLSMLREIGPVAMAVAFAGRVGSGMASELGGMVLGHQVDVMRVHGMDIVRKLVTPRVVAAVVMLPLLTFVGDAASILGGYYVSVFVTHQSGAFYLDQIRSILRFDNVLIGAVKPFVFGYLIACVSCHVGLTTSGGSAGLRRSTTNAVVASIIVVIVTDFVMTKGILFLLGMSR